MVYLHIMLGVTLSTIGLPLVLSFMLALIILTARLKLY
jgi:hypothetical protein